MLPEQLNIAAYFLDDRVREGRGDRVALRLPDGTLSYGEVQALANRFAAVLRGLHVQPGQRVLIALPDGAHYVGALFGILKLGAVVVMVNPQLTAAELRPIVDYSGAGLGIVGREALSAFVAVKGGGTLRTLLTVGVAGAGGDDPSTLSAWPAFEILAQRVGPAFENAATHRDDPAIWLFSGGTTGSPKAVVQSHRSFANTTEHYAKSFLGYREDDVTLAVPKLYFGYATGSNLFFPFAVGASAVLFPERSTADSVFAQLRRHRPTILINVPTMVNHMVSHPAAAAQDLSCLRFATSAGEALPAPLYRRWRELFGVELLDGLGTAEMWHIFLSNRPGEVRPGTLGRAVPGFEIRICDEQGREVEPGEVGRMWVRGDSLAEGYWQLPEKSAEAFRGGWYRSGDLVSRDADGWVTYGGRDDDVLKVGGRWLVPQEVESCLLRHPAVAECAVVGAASEQGLVKPRAFVVRKGEGGEDATSLAAELQALVRDELAPYKAPREVVFLDALPRTHLGKVDRGALKRTPGPGTKN